MQIAKVIGKVVCTRKDGNVPVDRLLVIEILDSDLSPTGSELVVVDTVDAGEGDIVLFSTGSSARMTELTWERPVDGTIVGIVDAVTRWGRPVGFSR